MSDLGDVHEKVEGHHATLTVYDEHVIIERDGIIATLSIFEEVGEKEIPISEITGVELYYHSIRINQQGHILPNSSNKRDLNTVVLSASQDADRLADKVKTTIRERKQTLSKEDPEDGTGDDALDTLRNRFAEGKITEEEFQRRRKMLLEDE